LAADLPVPAPTPRVAYVPPPPLYTWTGIYLGINGGYAFGTSSWSNPVFTTGNFNTNGWLVGGTLGGNYQIGQFVIGLEGDGDWTNINGTTNFDGCATFAGCKTSNDWLATVRGRAGWAWDRTLFYATGGAAFGNIQANLGVNPVTTLSTQTGWTAGAGIEGMFLPNWTAKIEYLYVNLGTATCPVAVCTLSPPGSVPLTENIVRAGINYKFW